MEATITYITGQKVVCIDGAGTVVTGVIADIMPGACRGGGMAMVKASWPGMKRASLRAIELADIKEVSA